MDKFREELIKGIVEVAQEYVYKIQKFNNTFLSSAYSDDWQRRTYTHSI